jgi:hypothetical protein
MIACTPLYRLVPVYPVVLSKPRASAPVGARTRVEPRYIEVLGYKPHRCNGWGCGGKPLGRARIVLNGHKDNP